MIQMNCKDKTVKDVVSELKRYSPYQTIEITWWNSNKKLATAEKLLRDVALLSEDDIISNNTPQKDGK